MQHQYMSGYRSPIGVIYKHYKNVNRTSAVSNLHIPICKTLNPLKPELHHSTKNNTKISGTKQPCYFSSEVYSPSLP